MALTVHLQILNPLFFPLDLNNCIVCINNGLLGFDHASSCDVVSPDVDMPVGCAKSVAAVLDPLLVLGGVFDGEVGKVVETCADLPVFVQVGLGQFL